MGFFKEEKTKKNCILYLVLKLDGRKIFQKCKLKLWRLTVNTARNMRELTKPPRIVNNSEDASFSRFISMSEKITKNKSKE